ncbi:MAG: hypothetical protein GVY26_13515 [Bacteroidetes bacterium]|jgi:hypothetical protein|nr:hypothetical protein [Bacteroidota bacterium]
MENRFFTIAALLLLPTLALPQVQEKMLDMSAGQQPALVLEIPSVSQDLVSDFWKQYMKDFYREKPKWQRRDDEWLSDDADLSALGAGNTVDVYAKTEEQGENVEIQLWVDLGGAFLNSREHPARYTEAEKLLLRFALEVAREKMRLDIEAQEDLLKDMNRDLERLASKKERAEREIERAKETIRQAEADIEQNLQEQADMQAKIAEQEKLIKKLQKQRNGL